MTMNATHASALPPARRGFTLVETLVAIAILMIAIVGPYYSVQQAIMASYAARDQLIATSLAEEAAEYIYYVRDSNYLGGHDWLYGMNSCLTNLHAYGCTVDPKAAALQYCSSAACRPLKLDGATQLYTYSTGTETRFTRIVKIDQVSSTQVRVTVTVAWETSHRDYTVTVTENLYNWL